MNADNKLLNLEILFDEYHDIDVDIFLVKQIIFSNDDNSIEDLLLKGKVLNEKLEKLLKYYSIIEIAYSFDTLPKPLPEKFENEIKNILSNGIIQKYYTEQSPFPLADKLYKRIEFQEWENYTAPSDIIYLLQFLEMIEIENDLDVKLFLKYLYNCSISKEVFDNNLVDILEDPRTILSILQKGPTEESKTFNYLNGLLKILQYFVAYYELLFEVQNKKYIHDIFWFYHSHWFKKFDLGLLRILNDCIFILDENLNAMEFNDYTRNIEAGDDDEMRELVLDFFEFKVEGKRGIEILKNAIQKLPQFAEIEEFA